MKNQKSMSLLKNINPRRLIIILVVIDTLFVSRIRCINPKWVDDPSASQENLEILSPTSDLFFKIDKNRIEVSSFSGPALLSQNLPNTGVPLDAAVLKHLRYLLVVDANGNLLIYHHETDGSVTLVNLEDRPTFPSSQRINVKSVICLEGTSDCYYSYTGGVRKINLLELEADSPSFQATIATY